MSGYFEILAGDTQHLGFLRFINKKIYQMKTNLLLIQYFYLVQYLVSVCSNIN